MRKYILKESIYIKEVIAMENLLVYVELGNIVHMLRRAILYTKWIHSLLPKQATSL